MDSRQSRRRAFWGSMTFVLLVIAAIVGYRLTQGPLVEDAPACQFRYDPESGAQSTRGSCQLVAVTSAVEGDCWRLLRERAPTEAFTWDWWGDDEAQFLYATIPPPADADAPTLGWGIFGPVVVNDDGTYSCR